MRVFGYYHTERKRYLVIRLAFSMCIHPLRHQDSREQFFLKMQKKPAPQP